MHINITTNTYRANVNMKLKSKCNCTITKIDNNTDRIIMYLILNFKNIENNVLIVIVKNIAKINQSIKLVSIDKYIPCTSAPRSESIDINK